MARLNNNSDEVNHERSENSGLKHRIKPGKKPYIIFFLLFLPILGSFVYISIVKDVLAIQGVLITLAIILTIHVYIYSQTIELFHDRITHSSWFFRKRTLFFKDINKWSVQIGVYNYWDRLKPTVRLEIHAKNSLNIDPVIIPLKLFNKSDLEPLFNSLPVNLEKK